MWFHLHRTFRTGFFKIRSEEEIDIGYTRSMRALHVMMLLLVLAVQVSGSKLGHKVYKEKVARKVYTDLTKYVELLVDLRAADHGSDRYHTVMGLLERISPRIQRHGIQLIPDDIAPEIEVKFTVKGSRAAKKLLSEFEFQGWKNRHTYLDSGFSNVRSQLLHELITEYESVSDTASMDAATTETTLQLQYWLRVRNKIQQKYADFVKQTL